MYFSFFIVSIWRQNKRIRSCQTLNPNLSVKSCSLTYPCKWCISKDWIKLIDWGNCYKDSCRGDRDAITDRHHEGVEWGIRSIQVINGWNKEGLLSRLILQVKAHWLYEHNVCPRVHHNILEASYCVILEGNLYPH